MESMETLIAQVAVYRKDAREKQEAAATAFKEAQEAEKKLEEADDKLKQEVRNRIDALDPEPR